MKKTLGSFSLKLAAATLVLGSVFLYQNCAQTLQTDSASLDTVEEASVDPMNTNPKLPGHTGDVNGHEFLIRKDPQVTTYGFQLMNKHQLLSTLTYVFGDEVLPLGIESYLTTYYAQFGGPCNLHEPVRFKNKDGKIQLEQSTTRDCNSITLNYTPAMPALTTPREALMDKICGRSVHTVATVRHALTVADARNTATALISIDSDPSKSAASRNYVLYEAFRLFYPTQPDPRTSTPELLESLRVFFANPAKPTVTEWQGVLYTLCISPYWQVL